MPQPWWGPGADRTSCEMDLVAESAGGTAARHPLSPAPSPSYSITVSSCAYGGAQEQRKTSGSWPTF